MAESELLKAIGAYLKSSNEDKEPEEAEINTIIDSISGDTLVLNRLILKIKNPDIAEGDIKSLKEQISIEEKRLIAEAAAPSTSRAAPAPAGGVPAAGTQQQPVQQSQQSVAPAGTPQQPAGLPAAPLAAASSQPGPSRLTEIRAKYTDYNTDIQPIINDPKIITGDKDQLKIMITYAASLMKTINDKKLSNDEDVMKELNTIIGLILESLEKANNIKAIALTGGGSASTFNSQIANYSSLVSNSYNDGSGLAYFNTQSGPAATAGMTVSGSDPTSSLPGSTVNMLLPNLGRPFI